MKKRILSVFLVLVMALGMIPGFSLVPEAKAEDAKEVQYDDYFTIDGVASNTAITGSNVLEWSDGQLHAIGVGSAAVGGVTVTVVPAKLRVMLLMGQSNAGEW